MKPDVFAKVLLFVAIILLAVNLFVMLSGSPKPAQAQGRQCVGIAAGPVHEVTDQYGKTKLAGGLVYRAWSDGTVEYYSYDAKIWIRLGK
jgi:hypothetical protein